MGAKEEKVREAIAAKYGNVLSMSKKTGIPATTIYHALDRGLDNTRTRTRQMIEYALVDMNDERGNGGDHEPCDDGERELLAIYRKLSDDERELLTYYRSLSTKGKHAVLTGLRDYADGQ